MTAACICDPEAYELGPEGQRRYFYDRYCPIHGEAVTRKRIYTISQTVTERYFYDPEQLKLDFFREWNKAKASGTSWEDFVIETFQQYDGSQIGERWFYNDANPQVGVEIHEGWDDE